MEEKPVGKTKQIQMLLRREVTNFARDRMALAGRIGFSTLLSVLIGAIFMGVGASDSSNIAVRIRFVAALSARAPSLGFLIHFLLLLQNLQSHFGALILIW